MLYVGLGWMGWDWMVIIGHRSFKSTFGANNNHYPMDPTISEIGQTHPANSVFH